MYRSASVAAALSVLPLALLVLGPSTPAGENSAAKPYRPHVAVASKDAELAIQRFRRPTGLDVELFAAEPLLANPVAFCLDEKGRCYVAETFRLHKGVTDNRGHMYWLDDDLASRTVADRVALYRKHLKDRFGTYETDHDRVRLVEDTDGDGKADRATVFADGFRHAADGLGSGVLARNGDVWYTCIPDLWRLRDQDGDGKAEKRDSLSTGYGVHVAFIGHDMHGLVFGPDGKLYFSIGDRGLNVRTQEGKHLFHPDTGAVLRCDPDGSNLEVVAAGLRNPQELAFDEHGNLFTGDNNSDSGDQARWVHVVEGGDSGWRMGYQYGSSFGDRGPWNAEKLWHLAHDGQPAYLVPPRAHLGNGPSGLCYYPGTGLPDRYAGHFFLCDFKGGSANSGIWTFGVKPKGASFEVVGREQFLWSCLVTDCEFGPDGGLYFSDWTEGWGLTGKGRIYRLTDPAQKNRSEVRKLLAEGFSKRPPAELAKLLEHADMRVRQGAQFALAERVESPVAPLVNVARASKNPLARLHAVWGLGQVTRRSGEAAPVLLPLLGDADAEVRAQTARVLGDVRLAAAAPKLVGLLKDAEPRVRFFAAQALGKVGRAEALPGLVQLLRDNADGDAYLRHAASLALAQIDHQPALLQAAADASPAVRMGVLLALRRLESPEIARFLHDAEPNLVLEAARAIHDVPIAVALPKLAGLIDRPNLPRPLAYRVLNAHFRLGKAENAAAVAGFAGRSGVAEELRVEALRMLGDWASPSGRDRVLGLWRPLTTRPANLAPEALRASLGGIFAGPDRVRQEAAKLAARFGLREVGPALLGLVTDRTRPAEVRAESLLALQALRDERLGKALEAALQDVQPRVRTAGLQVLARVDPSRALRELAATLDRPGVRERQGALLVLADLKDPEADTLLLRWLDRLLAGEVPPELQLDLLESAGRRSGGELRRKLEHFEASRRKDDPLAPHRETLAGGDAEAGRRLFFHKAEVSCVRCHRVGGEGGEVGPDLSKIGVAKKREYLLEALVDPNRQIAQGFEAAVLFLASGQAVTGVVKGEDAKEVRLVTTEGEAVTVPRDQIEERQKGPSAMPADVLKHLSKAEIRDLVEFLAGLK